MSTTTNYALRLSDAELDRYTEMARHARLQELDLWTEAGVVPGARVADIGCGPAAVLAELAAIVGPTGVAVGVEPRAGRGPPLAPCWTPAVRSAWTWSPARGPPPASTGGRGTA